MVLRRTALVVGSLLLSTATVHAVAPLSGRRVAAEELTAMPAAGTKPLRTARLLRSAPSAAHPAASSAWHQFRTATGAAWHATWDAATNVPSRLWGPGLAAPGANASPALAEQHARRLLAQHLPLLAPGAQLSDFALVSNHTDGELRSIGFVQRAAGRRVVGGQISFRFKNDRMFLIGSEALPHVTVALSGARLGRGALVSRAADNLRRELDLPTASVQPLSDDQEVILPLVGDHAIHGYRIATQIEIDGGASGRYLAYVDPASGAVLAVRQQNFYATGTVLYRGVDRYPSRGRMNRPARRVGVRVGGTPQTTSNNGVISWSPDTAQVVSTGVAGDLVNIVNKKNNGITPTVDLTISPGGQIIWDASADGESDAHLVTYLATNTVKEYVRNNIDPAMPKLDEPMTANVNIAQNCNAFFDGKTINFFHASMQCQNTGLLEDVIYHEFGHALHVAEIIEGVGSFDGAMSEGAADFLSAIITGDPGMGRGFFYNDEPLRQIDPMDREFSWPKDIGEIHQTGKVFGGIYWDMRKALVASMGEAAAVPLVNKIYLGALRRSVSIPTSLFEALAADDDDGDLSNGTPNECFIRDAYGRHGLRTATGVIEAPGVLAGNVPEVSVRVALDGLSDRCMGDEIERVKLTWKPDFGSVPAAGSADMALVSPTEYSGILPLASSEVTLYQATVEFKDGSILTLPDNLGLPWYQLYQGTTVPLYCTSFETDPFAEGWTTGTDDPNVASLWKWGTPTGTGSTDPREAYGGTGILGMNLGGDYGSKQFSYAALPRIDVGQWSDVRLQFRRWLAVEDSHYDQARVMVNGAQAWVNSTQNIGDASSIHHIDREWAFHDVRLSGYGFGHTMDISFELKSDEGLHLGGWQVDDLCVVANTASVCGDGVRSPTEACDEGPANSNEPDATCRTYCKLAECGDSIVDGDEQCDEGVATATCNAECKLPEGAEDGGCCGVGTSPQGAFGLAGVVGMLMLRRRRRARR